MEVNFKEIAGNNSAIMLTVLTRTDIARNKHYKIIFTQPVVTKPGLKRVAIVTQVAFLNELLKTLYTNNLEVEHIFDY
ncbi:MAG: hypothetical protein EOP51_22195 [Sphingobacteriales bacterium]|nr:MAG: hypothetical protein EOP51_22195 [Sphingobacteriales bacterium]